MHLVLNMFQDIGHIHESSEPSSSHAAASTFKVCARKLNLLTLRITCLDRLRWRYRGTIVGMFVLKKREEKAS